MSAISSGLLVNFSKFETSPIKEITGVTITEISNGNTKVLVSGHGMVYAHPILGRFSSETKILQDFTCYRYLVPNVEYLWKTKSANLRKYAGLGYFTLFNSLLGPISSSDQIQIFSKKQIPH